MTAAADFDVAIAGGGMVGASLACALGELGLRVVVIEAVPPGSSDQPSFDDRTIALSRSSQRILSTLGLWPDIDAAATPIKQIHVSQTGRFGTAVIDADEQGIEQLGFVVSNRELGRVLQAGLAGVELRCPARVSSTRVEDDHVAVTVTGEGSSEELTARLLVVADGARSSVRAGLGIGASESDYGQVAIIGNVAVDARYSGNTAFERFTPEGPLALLPIDEGRYGFVLTRHTDAAGPALDLDDEAFLELLQNAFGYRLGRLKSLGKRASYPLSLVCAEAVTAPRAVIIGNAAHAMHPVAGQGFNLGLRDVAVLAELIADDVRSAGDQADPGSAALLADYAGWRQDDQRSVVAFTDGLIRLFELDEWAGHFRGAGLQLFDMLPPAKRLLAHRTMGLGGRLTRLARGLPL